MLYLDGYGLVGPLKEKRSGKYGKIWGFPKDTYVKVI